MYVNVHGSNSEATIKLASECGLTPTGISQRRGRVFATTYGA